MIIYFNSSPGRNLILNLLCIFNIKNLLLLVLLSNIKELVILENFWDEILIRKDFYNKMIKPIRYFYEKYIFSHDYYYNFKKDISNKIEKIKSISSIVIILAEKVWAWKLIV